MESFTLTRDPVEHHEVVLVPVQYGGQGAAGKLRDRKFPRHSVQTKDTGGVGDPLHGYSLRGGVAEPGDRLQGAPCPKNAADHGEARHPALH